MINPGLSKYEVVLANKYYLRELIESISLEESLDEIAYRATIKLVVTPDFPGIAPGQEIRVSGIPFGGSSMVYLLHPGVVWEVESETRGLKHLTVTTYDKAIYLAKSEDEYLFPAGQTASQRLKRYAADWGVPLGAVTDTGISLAKAVYRAQPIWEMIMSDLKETVAKGGDMYRPRMTPDGLELVKLGSNKTVWVLEAEQNIEDLTQRRTLEGAVTQVKVLGHAGEDTRSPVLAIAKGETAKYGTLQRVISDEKIKTPAQAKTVGQKALAGMQETFTVTAIDINTIRAGDKMKLNSMELLVKSVRHELGSPGHMTLELASTDYIRRVVYGYGSV
ncbi:MAG: phage portal protein [Firmicutes bacterium]|nr:phage portal protein [Bacillota bacterium]